VTLAALGRPQRDVVPALRSSGAQS